MECKIQPPSSEYVQVDSDRRVKIEEKLSKSDTNKLISFLDNPEKYATGTSRAKEKVAYLESIKHKFSEGQLENYITAYDSYSAAVIIKNKSVVQKIDHGAILAKAFNNHESVKIRYKGSWRTIDPYSLNNTYVVAYCHFARDIRTFRVDRIQGAELLDGFKFDKSLQTTAQTKLVEAPIYKGHGYRHRY